MVRARLRRLSRRAARLAILLAGGFALLFALALTRPGRRLLLLSSLSLAERKAGLPVSAGDGDVELWNRRLMLTDLTVGRLVHADHVEIRWDWWALLRGRLREARAGGVRVDLRAERPAGRGGQPPNLAIELLFVDDVTVEGLPADLGVVRIAHFTGGFADGLPRGALDGTLTLRAAETLRRLAPIALSATLGGGEHAAWRLSLRSPEIELDAKGEFTARPWTIRGEARGAFPLQAVAPPATGLIEFSAGGRFDAQGPSVDFTASSPYLRHPGGPTEGVAAKGSIRGGQWRIGEARGRLPGGAVNASGRGGFSPLSAQAELAVENYDPLAHTGAAPGGVSLAFSGRLRLALDARELKADGAGQLALSRAGAPLLAGEIELKTRDQSPQLTADLRGPGGALRVEPANGRYRVSGELAPPSFAIARELASGRWPLGLELREAKLDGELDPRAPRFNGRLSGSGVSAGRSATLETTLEIDAQGWRAESLSIGMGEGSFTGRAAGALGFRWRALPARPFAFGSGATLAPAPARHRAARAAARGTRRGGRARVLLARMPGPAAPPARPAVPALPPDSLLVEGDFRGMPVSAFMPEMLAEWGVEGTLTGRVRLKGRSLHADLTLTGGRVRGAALPPLRITADGEEGRWRFRAVDASGDWEITGTGPRELRAQGRLPFDLAALLPAERRPAGSALAGEAEFSLVTGTEGPRLWLEYAVPDARWGDQALGPAQVALHGDPARPEFQVRLPAKGASLDGALALREGRWRARLDLSDAPLVEEILSKPLAASLSGSFSAGGDFSDPAAVRAAGWLAPVAVDWGRTSVAVDEALLAPAAGGLELPLRAGGPLGAGLGRLRLDPARGVALTLDTRGRAEFISAMIDRLYLEGDAVGNLRLRFPWSGDAELHGDWDAIRAAFAWTGLPFGLSDASGHVRLEGVSLHLEEMLFTTEGGRGRGSARLDFGPHGVDGVEIRSRADSTRLNFIPGLTATADSDLAITYGWDRGWRIGGRAAILGGRYAPPLAQATAAPADETDPSSHVELDLAITADDGLEIVSPLFRTAAAGRLEARGPAADPRLAGRLEGLPGGLLRFRNRQYALNHFILDFSGGSVASGQLDIEGETSVRSTRVFLAASGTLGSPRLEFRADGGLDQDNILTLLLTGYTREELLLRGAPLPTPELLNSYLIDPLGTLGESSGVTGGALIEYISLAPSQDPSRGLTAPSITFGKSVGDNLATLWRYDMGSNKFSFEGEYALSRRVRVGLTTGTSLGGVGGDLRYYTPFDWSGGARVERAELPAVKIASLQCDGLTEGDPLLRKLRGALKPGRRHASTRLYAAIDRLREGLRKRGHLLARVNFTRRDDPAGARLVVNVASGPVLELAVWEGERRRGDLEKRLRAIDLDIPFLEEFDARAREVLDAALAAEGRLDRALSVERGGEGDRRSLAYRFAAAPRYRAARIGKREWPAAPEGVRPLRDCFPSLRGSLRLTPLPRIRPAYDAVTLEGERRGCLAGLRDAGYLDATLELRPRVEGGRVRAEPRLVAGTRARVARIEYAGGEPPLPPDRLPLREGDPLTGAGLRALRDALYDALWSAGHRGARVDLAAKRGEPGTATVSVTLDAGPAQRVRGIAVEGLKHARKSVVWGRLSLHDGDPLDPRRIDESRTALFRSGVFSAVSLDAMPTGDDPGRVDLKVSVRERPRFEFGGSLGWDSEERARESILLAHNDFLGRARRLSLSLKNSDIERRGELTYRDPGLFGSRVEFSFTARYQFLSTVSYDQWRRGFDARATLPLTPRLALQGVAQLTRVTLGDVRISFDKSQEQLRERSTSVPSVGGAIVWNRRDDAFNPRRGELLSFGLEYANPVLAGSNVRFTKLTLTGFLYRPLGTGAVWAQGLRAGYIATPLSFDAFPLSERFYAGGDGTVRGFRRDLLGPADPATGNPLGGLTQLIFNEELRLPVGAARRVHLSLFTDGGAVGEKRFATDDIRWSYGAGFFYLSPLGPLRLEYARPYSPRAGEPSYQIHFAIGRAF